MKLNVTDSVVRLKSDHSVEDTIQIAMDLLAARGVKLFALIDHSGEAEKAGLRMPNTKLLIFGHPKAGTPIMIAAPSAALDLPLKLLVAEDSDGAVWLSFNNPSYLQAKHNIPSALMPAFAAVETLAKQATRSKENV